MDELKKRPRPEEARLPRCSTCMRFNRNLTENLSGGVKGLESKCSRDNSLMVWPDKPGCIEHTFIQKEFVDAALGSIDTSINVIPISQTDVSDLMSTLEEQIHTLFGIKGAMAVDWAGKNKSWEVAAILQGYQELMIGRFVPIITRFVTDSIEVYREQQSKYFNLAMASMRHEIQEALNNAHYVNMGGSGTHRETMNELLRITTEAIEKAAADKSPFSGESINWGDLTCVNVEHVKSISEDYNASIEYRVFIEEAGPECTEFRKFIEDKIYAAGYTKVEVITEW